jgi:hypothetical protein
MRVALALSSILLIVSNIGCDSGSGNGGGSGSGGGGGGGPALPVVAGSQEAVYLGYDGAATFEGAAALFFGPSLDALPDVTWEAGDEALLAIETIPPTEAFPIAVALVGSKAAGSTTLTAVMDIGTAPSADEVGDGCQASGTTVRCTYAVEIASYTAAQLQAGEARYRMPANAEGDATRQACAACHENESSMAPRHDPLWLSSFSDSNILPAIKAGVAGDGYELQVEHSWNLTPEEEAGIVPFLRSLPLNRRLFE